MWGKKGKDEQLDWMKAVTQAQAWTLRASLSPPPPFLPLPAGHGGWRAQSEALEAKKDRRFFRIQVHLREEGERLMHTPRSRKSAVYQIA